MKKFSLFLPIFLAACLLAIWLIARSRSTESRPSPEDVRRPATNQQSDPRNSESPKQASSFPQTQVAESPELKETRALLAELSEQAKLLEQGGLWIQNFRAKNSQPDPTMWKLRLLGHRHPAAMKHIEQFVRSDEPLAARIFAVFSFVAPQNADTIDFVASLMRDPPSSAMANAACLCCDAWAANGIGGAWDSLFGTYSGMLGFPKPRQDDRQDSMWGESHAFVYLPDDWKEHQELYKSHSYKLDLTPIVHSIVSMLSKADDDVWRNKWMKMAWQIMNHPKATAEDRDRLREITVKWYLEFDPGPGWDPKGNCYRFGNGWMAAMESLTKSWSQPELNVVGAGLSRLTPEHKTYVLDEVASRANSQLFGPPFVDHIEDALVHLAKAHGDGGPMQGSFTSLCSALVIHAPTEEWTRQFLASHSGVIRQRMADAIAGWASGGDYKEDRGRRFFAAAEYLIKDEDFKVRLSAATTFHGLTGKRNQVLSVDDLGKARAYLDSWLKNESARNLTAAESDQLKRFTANLQH